jgi:hypothetical protein
MERSVDAALAAGRVTFSRFRVSAPPPRSGGQLCTIPLHTPLSAPVSEFFAHPPDAPQHAAVPDLEFGRASRRVVASPAID